MRLTNVLCKQHLDRMFKKHWKIQGRRTPIETGAETELRERGLVLTDPVELLKEQKPQLERVEVIGFLPKPVARDETHPLYHQRPCYAYQDNSVLVEGLQQAQVLINAVEVKKGLPVTIEDLAEASAAEQPDNLDELVQRCILSSHLFDAFQEKLPKFKDPKRPGFNFPRIYGIPDYRRNRLMTDRLLGLCGSLGRSAPGLVVRGSPVRTYLERGADLLGLEVTPGVLLSGAAPLAPHANTASVQATENSPLPDIYPLKPTISIKTTHFYQDREIYSLAGSSLYPHIHTAVFHNNETRVTNLHEEPVTESQVMGRSLVHTFALALAAAKHRFGDQLSSNQPLPEPVTVQSVQTDGRWFHFVVLQLNTLAAEGVRNIVWSTPLLNLFSSCKYSQGAPVLKGYNPKVFNNLLAFYNNSVITKK